MDASPPIVDTAAVAAIAAAADIVAVEGAQYSQPDTAGRRTSDGPVVVDTAVVAGGNIASDDANLLAADIAADIAAVALEWLASAPAASPIPARGEAGRRDTQYL